MAKEKKITAEKKFTLVLEQNEQLLKEIENLEDRYQTVTDGLYILQGSLNRIANALEEVLRLVKQDQEESKKR